MMIHDMVYGTTNELRKIFKIWNPTIHSAWTSQNTYRITESYYDLIKQINYLHFEYQKVFTSLRVLDSHVSKLL